MKEKLAIWTLGLEEDIWANIGASEKKQYQLLGYSFAVLTLLACSGSFTLMWVVTSSFAASIFAGLLLSFIIANIIRFSMITLRRSLYIDSLPKTEVPEASWNLWQKTMHYGKKFFLSLKTDLSTIIRSFVLLVMLQLIAFPNTILMLWPHVRAINEIKRAELVKEFIERKSVSISAQINSNNIELNGITSSLDTLVENAGETNLLLRKKRDEKTRLLGANETLKLQQDSLVNHWVPQFAVSIEKSYFPVLTFTSVGKTTLLLFTEIVLIFLMFYSLRILKRLKNGEHYSYARESTDFYREKVFEDYEKHLIVIQKNLNRFGVNAKYNDIWSDPPFCNTYKKTVSQKKFQPLSNLIKPNAEFQS